MEVIRAEPAAGGMPVAEVAVEGVVRLAVVRHHMLPRPARRFVPRPVAAGHRILPVAAAVLPSILHFIPRLLVEQQFIRRLAEDPLR